MKRKEYVKLMLKAIELAKRNSFNEKTPSSKTDALRVIKRFENINSMKFDPSDKRHLQLISGNGCNEGFFRAIKLLTKRYEKK